MKTQEINFRCRGCRNELLHKQQQCEVCGFLIEWEETAVLDYEDKYLQIFTVFV